MAVVRQRETMRSQMVTRTYGLALASLSWFTVGNAQAADPMAYGKHLASECTSCHKSDGQDRGIPSITGWDKLTFIETMRYYQTGARPNPAMQSVAQSLDEKQIEALATYLGSLARPPRAVPRN